MEFKYEVKLLIRYFLLMILILFFISNFFINILTDLFLKIVYFFFNFYKKIIIIETGFKIENNTTFLILKECIASQVYILITIVFFTLPIKLKKIFKIWSLSVIYFTILNLIRIIILIGIYLKFGIYYFEKLHILFYEGLTGVLTGLIIVYFVKKEKIKVYPIYSDVKNIINKYFIKD